MVAVAAVVVAVAGLGQRMSESVARYAEAAQRVGETMAVEPLGDEVAYDRAAGRLLDAEAARRGDDPATTVWRGAVVRALEYLRVCSTADAGVYAEWAELNRMSVPGAWPVWGAFRPEFYAARYADAVGAPMPAGISPRAYFDAYFEAYWRRAGGEFRPASIAVDPRSIEVRLQTFRHWGDYIDGAARADGLGAEFWQGGIGAAGMMLWWPERALPGPDDDDVVPGDLWRLGGVHDVQKRLYGGLIERRGAVQAARVMLVYRSATGINVPMTFFLIRRPSDGGWEICGLSMANVGSDVGVGSAPLLGPPY